MTVKLTILRLQKNHALLPFVQLNEASNPEKEFVKYLEEHSQWIDWWYKNGTKENNIMPLHTENLILR